MRKRLDERGFLSSKAALALTIVLIAQSIAVYGFTRKEVLPQHTALAELPPDFGQWRQVGEHPIEKEVMDILRADDTLNRTYANQQSPIPAHLFVAFFKTQRTGVTPHSPKNCLPGTGWTPIVSDTITIDNVPGRTTPLEANRYLVQRGDAKSLVLYWYQSRDRTVANEYAAKFYVVADAMRYNRTDTALVRVVVPIGTADRAVGEELAKDFIRSVYARLRTHFPA